MARPLENVTPSSVLPYAVSTLPEAVDPSPVIAFEPLDSNALTTPESVCASFVWMYLRTPAVVEPLSNVHDTTVPYAVPPVTVCVIFSSTEKSAEAPVILSAVSYTHLTLPTIYSV